MIFIRFNNIQDKEEAFNKIKESGLTMCCCTEFECCFGLKTCLYDVDKYKKERLLKSGVSHIHGLYSEYDETPEEYIKFTIDEYNIRKKECIECHSIDEFINKCKKAWGL